MSKETEAIYRAIHNLDAAQKLYQVKAAEIRESLTHLIDREIRFKRGTVRDILSAGIIEDLGCHSGQPVFNVTLIRKDGKFGGRLPVYPYQILEWMPQINNQPTE